jgi:signal transduction histidine kinase
MMDHILQLISLFLVAAGFLFILIELFVKFDRTFLFLGIALIIFGFIPTVDIWIVPREHSPAEILFWKRIQHILALMLFPVILWYLKNFLKSDIKYFHYIVLSLAVVSSPVFFSNAALSLNGDGTLVFGPWYYFFFMPFVAMTGGATVWLIFEKLKEAKDNERRILFYHMIGFSLLCFFGFVDLSVKLLSNVFTTPLPNFFIFGIFAFGVMIFLVFTERFLLLVQERRKVSDQLRVALREMEEASTLRQIGESTSIINHEIKNYLTAISGSAEFIKLTENLSDDGKQEINNIMKRIKDLQDFSMDILQLSRARIVKEKERLTLVPLLRQCIGSYFPDQRERIVLETRDETWTIRGEWNKLEHVFVNILKNAFEAEATKINLRMSSTGAVLLITITDNGIGCSAEQRGNLFKVFYTTKKGKQGTGLGLAISRAVIESHGGHITAYSLNGLGNGSHGLQMNISLPHGEKVSETQQPDIVLIQDGIADLNAVLQIFNNVNVYPLIVESGNDLEKKKQGGTIIVASEKSLKSLRQRQAAEGFQAVMLSCNDHTMYAGGADGAAPPGIFSEEFVVNNLVRTA